jgi:Arc/MetJ-type ribon-helix-helix transcriptional regulator
MRGGNMGNKKEEKEENKASIITYCHNGGHHSLTHRIGKKIVVNLGHGLEGRDNVVMTRLNDEDLAKIDALVEVEVFKSRSEAAAFFIKEGIKAQANLFGKVMQTVEQIRKLKNQAKQSLGTSSETEN